MLPPRHRIVARTTDSRPRLEFQTPEPAAEPSSSSGGAGTRGGRRGTGPKAQQHKTEGSGAAAGPQAGPGGSIARGEWGNVPDTARITPSPASAAAAPRTLPLERPLNRQQQQLPLHWISSSLCLAQSGAQAGWVPEGCCDAGLNLEPPSLAAGVGYGGASSERAKSFMEKARQEEFKRDQALLRCLDELLRLLSSFEPGMYRPRWDQRLLEMDLVPWSVLFGGPLGWSLMTLTRTGCSLMEMESRAEMFRKVLQTLRFLAARGDFLALVSLPVSASGFFWALCRASAAAGACGIMPPCSSPGRQNMRSRGGT